MGTSEGIFAVDQLEKLMVQRSFFGINGIDNKGYSVSREDEAQIKRCFCSVAKESYILADSTKFGRRYLIKAIDIDASPDHIISDVKRPDFDYREIEKHTSITFVG
jgi:DeoR/GlpR family transcriptional regulator of sugar metabolism